KVKVYKPEVIEYPLVDDEPKYDLFDVANWFLCKANLSQKKLQKLCYYAQAWSYALNGYRLMNSDFQAWIHGPVSPALYERFRSYGYDTIKIHISHAPVFEKKDEKLLNDVWETYGSKTGNALEALSHTEDPWIEARRGYSEKERCSVVISPTAMRDYYRSIYIDA
ncbi:MAG: Panacea domain-containing protein, partial [Candidatus Ornithospirochaeta sp.]